MMTPMTSRPDRRSFLYSGLAAVGLAALPLPAFALSDASAKSLVTKIVSEINKVIASGKSERAMINDFEQIFIRYADVSIIARSTLGADSRRATNTQMRSFTQVFQGYVARKYGKRFREFIGGRIEVKSVRRTKSWHEVISTAYLQGSSPFEVRFLVSDRSGKVLFFDMVIEGVSLRLSERTEIGAMLDARQGDINALIRDLKKAG